MKDDDIEAVYPIPSRRPTVHSGTDVRDDEPPPANANTILVRFRDCKTRDQVIRQRRQLKNTRITTVEDLSSLNPVQPHVAYVQHKVFVFFSDRNSGEVIAGAASKHSKKKIKPINHHIFATISVSYSSFILLRS